MAVADAGLRWMLYFAYGSNMDWAQMQSRCPSADFVAIASLPDYRLIFPRHSRLRGCDVASIAVATGELVWGVVYRIDDGDRLTLDTCEGFRPGRDRNLNSYEPIEIGVLRRGVVVDPINVITYVARPQNNFRPCGPNEEHCNLILGRARYWQLPHVYIRRLELICRPLQSYQ